MDRAIVELKERATKRRAQAQKDSEKKIKERKKAQRQRPQTARERYRNRQRKVASNITFTDPDARIMRKNTRSSYTPKGRRAKQDEKESGNAPPATQPHLSSSYLRKSENHKVRQTRMALT